MTTLIDPTTTVPSNTSAAQRLRRRTAATKVSFTWFGTRKTLTPEQKELAAESFGAEGDFLSAAKKLLDVKHPAFKAVTAVRGKVVAYWRSLTLPFPEPGVRLIGQDRIDEFDRAMNAFKEDLQEAVANLDRNFTELKLAAAERLGSLYDESDYPSSLRGLFGVGWSYPSVEPPDYLMDLNPQLYEEERARVSARFEEAVRLAEQAFIEEFAKLVAHLCERTSGSNGEKKVFRDSAVGNLREFFDRFRDLSVNSNAELEELVSQAQRIVRGVEPQHLRESDDLRQQVASQFSQVRSSLDELMVDRPRRRILRASARQEDR